MPLRGKKPTTIDKRLKLLVYGPPGVGKTTAAIQFPRPYLIDTERGAENESYVTLLEQAGGAYYFTNDPSELLTEIRSLLSEQHDYKTLVIDPLTTVYNDLLDHWASKLATREDPTGTSFSRHKGPADRTVKHLLNLLLRLDMNVIITSHAKTKWEKRGKDVVDAGLTFDCYTKLDYLFDLALEVQLIGTDHRVAYVRKSRLGQFQMGEQMPFSYDEIAERYGLENIEREAVPVELATPEQVKEMTDLLALRVDGEQLLAKWLDKSQSADPSEMPAETIEKCIGFLKNQKEGE